MNDSWKSGLERVSSLLLRCTLLGLALLTIWTALLLVAPETIWRTHASIFPALTRPAFELILYGALAFTKICVILFFLTPYLAIRWTLRKEA